MIFTFLTEGESKILAEFTESAFNQQDHQKVSFFCFIIFSLHAFLRTVSIMIEFLPLSFYVITLIICRFEFNNFGYIGSKVNVKDVFMICLFSTSKVEALVGFLDSKNNS